MNGYNVKAYNWGCTTMVAVASIVLALAYFAGAR
jgi:hypothetical protein